MKGILLWQFVYLKYCSLQPCSTASIEGPGAVAATADNILSEIDREMAGRRGIAPVLELLDRRRAELQRYFLERLGSPAAAKALTLKVMNLCVARFHFLARSTTLLSRPYGLEVDPINSRPPRRGWLAL